MRNIWELSPEELAAEAAKIAPRLAEADAEAAALFWEQDFLLHAEDDEIREAFGEEAEAILLQREGLYGGEADSWPCSGESRLPDGHA